MKKLLFVTMLGLLSVGVCKAAEEVQLKSADLYKKDGCGLCGGPIKSGDLSAVFFSPLSKRAHTECFGPIMSIASDAYKSLYKALPEAESALELRNQFMCELARLVQEQAKPVTILEYVQQEHGVEMLAQLFNNNIQCAIQFATKLSESNRLKLPKLLLLKKKQTT